MTVLHIMQCTNLGGMEQVAFRCMEGLTRTAGLRFRLTTPRPFGPGRERVLAFDPAARDFSYRGRFGWRDFPAFRRHVHHLARDCSHVWVTGTCAASLAAVRDLRLPKVLSHHYHHFEGRWSWFRWRAFYELLCRSLDAITYPTRFTRAEALRIAPWLGPKAVVVPNGYGIYYRGNEDHDAMRREARLRLGLPENVPVIGNAGWLIARKRFDVFLDTAALVLRVSPDARFVICGDGPLRADLEARARSLGIAGSVQFRGWVADLAEHYRAWDVVLFNSDFDAFGVVPLEAAGYGCPTVASVRYGGLGEFITHGQNGFLFSDHDTRALADAVMGLLGDPGLMSRMRAAARMMLASRFSEDASLAFYRDFFGAPAAAVEKG